MKKILLITLVTICSLSALAQTDSTKNVTLPVDSTIKTNHAADTAKRHLNEGTLISVQLDQELNSKTANVGDVVALELSEPIIINSREILSKGIKVSGVVTQAGKARGLGKAGTLSFTINYIILPDGRNIKLTSEQSVAGKTTTAAMAAEAVLLTPFFLFKKGKNITYEKGKIFKVFVAQDYDI
jgi:hypothetical protein